MILEIRWAEYYYIDGKETKIVSFQMPQMSLIRIAPFIVWVKGEDD